MKNLFAIFLGLLMCNFLSAQVTIIVEEVPDNTPEDNSIYLAGSINGWQPGDENFVLEKSGDFHKISLNQTDSFEYKFTLGSWETVETSSSGQDISNRKYDPSADHDTIWVSIEGWKSLENESTASTKADNVFIIEDFEMPQLNRSRRIWVYLPPGYEENTKDYPILYMQDGQNLFDNATSFSGEWGVDESLNAMADSVNFELIVVGIDNGGQSRINEYSPWYNSQYGGGEGEEYAAFLVETLKPYIESNYRVSRDPNYNAIMGSSLGALISYYTTLKYPDQFTKVGILSPAFWINPEIYSFDADQELTEHSFYFQAGAKESQVINDALTKAPQMMSDLEISENRYIVESVPDGTHSEWFWNREFPKITQWLFSDHRENQIISTTPNTDFKWFLNNDSILIEDPGHLIKQVVIHGLEGKIYTSESLSHNSNISIAQYPKGIYTISFITREQLITGKILIR